MSKFADLAEAEEIVSSAAQDVLEAMFFTTAGEQAEAPEEQPEMVRARVGFRGTWNGSFRLCIPEPALRDISANFLGLDGEEELSGAEQNAVMGELVNMICGSALSRLEGDGDFHLDTPKLFSGDVVASTTRGVDVTVPLEYGPLRLHLAIHEV